MFKKLQERFLYDSFNANEFLKDMMVSREMPSRNGPSRKIFSITQKFYDTLKLEENFIITAIKYDCEEEDFGKDEEYLNKVYKSQTLHKLMLDYFNEKGIRTSQYIPIKEFVSQRNNENLDFYLCLNTW